MLKNMGGEGPGFGNRNRAGGFDILEHCHTLGLGAVRLNVPQGPDAVRAVAPEARHLRHALHRQRRAAPHGRGGGGLRGVAIAAAREMGAVTTHASFTARRYEEFETFEAFQASFEAHKKSVERAEPILRKHKMKLAIENHKGWRAAEHAAWVRQVGSEVHRRLLRLRQQSRALRGSGRHLSAARTADDLRELQGHGGGAVRGGFPALRDGARRGHARHPGNGQGPAAARSRA